MKGSRFRKFIPLALGLITIVARAVAGASSGAADASVVELLALFTVILICTASASHYADQVAHRLGEPIGTLVLTLSVITIEVAVVASMMVAGHGESTVARDTMFATLMIIMNGFVGVALLVGGIKRHEQFFNLQSSASFITLIIPLALVAMVLPRLTETEPGGLMASRMEVFVAVASIALYASFLWLQSSRYQSFFVHPVDDTSADFADLGRLAPASVAQVAAKKLEATQENARPLWRDVAWLVVTLALVVVLAESLGGTTVGVLEANHLPPALAGVLVALLILGPEGVAAIKAARDNSMQRTMNILLGSALSTIGMTVPAVLITARILGTRAELGLEPPEIALLVGTILVSMVNFTRGRVNPMQGLVHLTLFLTYLALIFDLPPAG